MHIAQRCQAQHGQSIQTGQETPVLLLTYFRFTPWVSAPPYGREVTLSLCLVCSKALNGFLMTQRQMTLKDEFGYYNVSKLIGRVFRTLLS